MADDGMRQVIHDLTYAPEMVDRGPDGLGEGRELRVHGIGSHGPLSAVGAPVILDSDGDPSARSQRVSVYAVPTAPAHGVRMLNWSRLTRKTFGATWWFVFPLTVANAAGYTAPPGDPEAVSSPDHPPALHTVMMWFWTTIITIGYVLWTFALIETLPRKLPDEVIFGLQVLAAAAYALVILRRIRGSDARPVGPLGKLVTPPKSLWVVQLLAVIAVGFAVLAWQPATKHVDGDARAYLSPQTWASSCWDAGEHDPTCANRVDVLSGYVILSTGVAAIGLIAVAAAATTRRRDRSSLRATLIVSTAVVLMNVVFASLRTGLSWISRYLEQIPILDFACKAAEFNQCLPETEARHSLLPYQRRGEWPIYDLVPVGIVWLIVLVAIGLGVRSVWRAIRARMSDEDALDVQFRRRVASAEKVRERIAALPWTSRKYVLGVATVLVAFTAVTLWIGAGHQTNRSSAPWIVLLAVHATALLVPLIVLATAAIAPVRTAVTTIGDVIGYWPRGFAALSGGSYTEEVCRSIEREVVSTTAPIVLVGHSQGSVLCYTALTRIATPGEHATELDPLPAHVSLVTCGSPLHSLYVGFFPRYFRDRDFRALRQALGTRWSNAWRPTDPIATPFLAPDADLEIEPTWDYRQKLNRHSNYWTEPVQADEIERLIGMSTLALLTPGRPS